MFSPKCWGQNYLKLVLHDLFNYLKWFNYFTFPSLKVVLIINILRNFHWNPSRLHLADDSDCFCGFVVSQSSKFSQKIGKDFPQSWLFSIASAAPADQYRQIIMVPLYAIIYTSHYSCMYSLQCTQTHDNW